MNEISLSDAQRELIRIIASSLKGEKFKLSDKSESELIYQESRQQAVMLQAYDAIEWGCVEDDQIRTKWEMNALFRLRDNHIIHNQHQYIHELLSKNGIRYCILKGSASARYYKKQHIRAMGDVDFLVAPADLKKAREVLVEDGFTEKEAEHICHIVFKKEKIRVEMHFKPAGMPDGKAGEIIEKYLADIFDRSEQATVGGFTFTVPSHFHHGLIILMHMYHHLLSEGIGLRHLCDWAVFVDSFDNREFEDLFREKLSACGLWRFAQILSLTVAKYLDIPYRQWMGKADETIIDSLIADVVCGGNFGCKDGNRTTEGFMISNRGKDGVRMNSFVQMIKTTNAIADTTMPRLRKIPILKHFAFVPMAFRYLFRVTFKKRKKRDFIGAISGARNRKELYKEFRLFEVE